MDMARQAALKKSESAVVAAMNSTYFAAKHNLASAVVPEINQLMLNMVNKMSQKLGDFF